MSRLFTREGDAGRTRDFSGRSLAKDDLRIVISGKIDSLQSALDLALLTAKGETKALLHAVQKKLWQSAGELSRASEACVPWPVTEHDIEALENFIARLGRPPGKFVRFKRRQAIQYNECRVRCRELESACTPLLRAKKLRPAVYRYLNRLSSLLFMLAYEETPRKG